MIDMSFNSTERFLNIDKDDVLFFNDGDKMVACKIEKLKLYWPYFNGYVGVNDISIVAATGKRYGNRGIERLYAHPEDIREGKTYISTLNISLDINEIIKKGYSIPNFIDERHYAVVYKWDGFKPVPVRLGVSFEVIGKEISFNGTYASDPKGKFYTTPEECAKDNVMKVVMFP